MAKKRANNEGTIYKRSNGTWRAQITLDGERLNFSADTQRECQQWLRKKLNHIAGGLTYDATITTLGEFLADWLTYKETTLKSSTYYQYNHVVESYIIPYLGQIKLMDLKPVQIQALYNRLIKDDVGIPTIQKVHTVFHSALSYACKIDLITRNPASVIDPPKTPNKEMKILDQSQISQLLITVDNHRWKALYYLAIRTGMRQSEILGLMWTDIDWGKQTLNVERQLKRPKGNEVNFTTLKTNHGKRNIALGHRMVAILREHYKRQHALQKKAGKNWPEHGLIFTTSVGTPIHQRNLLRDFKNQLEKAGLPEIRFHDLRHTAASVMLNHNFAVIKVSRMLGHARPSITLDIYGHLLPSMQSADANLMDDLVMPEKIYPGCTTLHQDYTKEEDQPIETPYNWVENQENPRI